jgi:antitoxin component of RelBE/YafQ-DinJ toxin-antitoxin module
MHVVFDQRLRRTVAASVGVDRAEEGAEVTTAGLRDVRVQYLVAVSSMRVVEVTREQGKPEPLREYLADVKARTDRSYEETVREAVTLYRIAATVNLAPLKLVSEHLGVSVSTATRMMARAREAGLAVDLITRETYNRLRTEDEDRARPHQVPGSPSGPSIGR